jgi:ABC-type branched-subunit amino acid transport system substrate-binding protein
VCEINEAAPEKHLIDAMSFAPEAILLPFEGKKAARYFKILRQSGYMGIICGPDSWDDPAFFKELQGVKNPGLNFYTAFFSDSARHSEYRSFKENFRKKCYYYPGSCEIQTFDAINTLLAGLGNNASSLKKFDRNWRSLRKYAGAAAIYTMLPKNQIDRTIYINRVGVSQTDRKRLVPGNITGLQYSRLKVYDVDDE